MISIIVCIAKNGAIGHENKLIYWLPNDMKRFRQLTTGHTIIMGRRTFESLPKGALPNRRNIVLSRQTSCTFAGAECFASLDEALQHCTDDEDIYIIGGATVYEQAFPLADRLLVTLVEDIPEKADTFFPPINPEHWIESGNETFPADERHSHAYSFIDYQRKR